MPINAPIRKYINCLYKEALSALRTLSVMSSTVGKIVGLCCMVVRAVTVVLPPESVSFWRLL